MIERKLSPEMYQTLRNDLMEKAHAEPGDAAYTVDLRINGVSYAVKLLPAGHCRLVVLQASRMDRYRSGTGDQLITNNILLKAFLEILLLQGIR